MKKIYYLLFYKIYKFFKSISDDGWADWKAFVIIGAAEMILCVELLVWWTIVTKTGVKISKYWLAVPTGLFISVFNYYLFLHHDSWKTYEEEFKSYSRTKSIILGWIIFLILSTIIVSLIFAFYQMSLIDWSRYR